MIRKRPNQFFSYKGYDWGLLFDIKRDLFANIFFKNEFGGSMQDFIEEEIMHNKVIPITRFNKGEADKIFMEVAQNDVMLVTKRKKRICVLVSLEKYDAMIETIEDFKLFLEASSRLEKAQSENLFTHKEVMEKLGVTEADLEGVEVDIG